MGSINDWAMKAAREVLHVPPGNYVGLKRERIAAIIALHTQPLIDLLRETERSHFHDALYHRTCCPQCTCQSNDYEEPEPNSDEPCTCGAAEWNAKIEKALEG